MTTEDPIRIIPARFQSVLFAFILSGMMTLIVSAITTVRNLGLDEASLGQWLSAFASSWPITLPTVLLVAPIVRKMVSRVLRSE